MLKKSTQKGFSIIEVLIVLAIAGLIMLIVFLAVPALQRNSRNTGRKNDVGRIGSAVQEFVGNNNGALPSTALHAAAIAKSAGNLNQYDFMTNQGKLTIVKLSSGTESAVTDIDSMKIVTGTKCGASGTAETGTVRNISILYAVENSTDITPVCLEI